MTHDRFAPRCSTRRLLPTALAVTLLCAGASAGAQGGVRDGPVAPSERRRELSHEPANPRAKLNPVSPPLDAARAEVWGRLGADQRRGAMEGLLPATAQPVPPAVAPVRAAEPARRLTPEERRALRQQIRQAHRERRAEAPGPRE